MGKKIEKSAKTIPVIFRLSEKDVALLDCCAKLDGLPRSAYVRNIVLAQISEELGEETIGNTEKIIRKTLETILDIKTKKQMQTLRTLVGEIQRANYMQLKSYIEQHPNLDLSEYRAYYYQSQKEAYELSSGKRSMKDIFHLSPSEEDSYEDDTFSAGSSPEDVPDWIKLLSGEEDE